MVLGITKSDENKTLNEKAHFPKEMCQQFSNKMCQHIGNLVKFLHISTEVLNLG